MDLPYKDVLSQIKTGDLLAFSGTGPLHLGVRAWTGLTYWRLGYRPRILTPLPLISHVGMALWVNDYKLYLLEQELSGCRMQPLEKCIRSFRGSVYWYPLCQELDRQAMERCGLDLVGDPYSYRALIKVFIRGIQDYTDPSFCSALYRVLLKAGGYDWNDWNPLPDEIVELPCLRPGGRLVLESS